MKNSKPAATQPCSSEFHSRIKIHNSTIALSRYYADAREMPVLAPTSVQKPVNIGFGACQARKT
jgi:hypothetical protein